MLAVVDATFAAEPSSCVSATSLADSSADSLTGTGSFYRLADILVIRMIRRTTTKTPTTDQIYIPPAIHPYP